jgi:hypothetical protein
MGNLRGEPTSESQKKCSTALRIETHNSMSKLTGKLEQVEEKKCVL